jgi:hypothetical protein
LVLLFYTCSQSPMKSAEGMRSPFPPSVVRRYGTGYDSAQKRYFNYLRFGVLFLLVNIVLSFLAFPSVASLPRSHSKRPPLASILDSSRFFNSEASYENNYCNGDDSNKSIALEGSRLGSSQRQMGNSFGARPAAELSSSSARSRFPLYPVDALLGDEREGGFGLAMDSPAPTPTRDSGANLSSSAPFFSPPMAAAPGARGPWSSSINFESRTPVTSLCRAGNDGDGARDIDAGMFEFESAGSASVNGRESSAEYPVLSLESYAPSMDKLVCVLRVVVYFYFLFLFSMLDGDWYYFRCAVIFSEWKCSLDQLGCCIRLQPQWFGKRGSVTAVSYFW